MGSQWVYWDNTRPLTSNPRSVRMHKNRILRWVNKWDLSSQQRVLESNFNGAQGEHDSCMQ